MKLQVFEAYTRDVGRMIARIDYDTMDELLIQTGNSVMIKGKKNTPAKALPLYPSDESRKMIRIDGITRKNCDAIIKEFIEIEKITDAPIAIEITVRPIHATPPLDGAYIAECLDQSPVIKDTVFNVPYFGGRIEFVVEDTQPNGTVMILQNRTKVIINEEPLPKKLLDLNKKIMERYNELFDAMKAEVDKSIDNSRLDAVSLGEMIKIFQRTKEEIQNYSELYETLKLLYFPQSYHHNLLPTPTISSDLQDAIMKWHKSKEREEKKNE